MAEGMKHECSTIINGMGARITQLDKEHTATKVMVNRNTQDMQKVWDGINKLSEVSAFHMDKMSKANEKAKFEMVKENAKTNKDLLTRLIFIFVVGVGLMILKDLVLR